jgi:hypothetical protein
LSPRWEVRADNVGGVLRTLPAGDGPIARAIAVGMSHPFGVGTSYFPHRHRYASLGRHDRVLLHSPRDLRSRRAVRRADPPSGRRIQRPAHQAWRRILLVPDVESQYYARATQRQTARMFYQFGVFTPLVAIKLGRVMTLRQLVPPLFVLALAVTGITALLWHPAELALALVGGSYAAIVLASAVRGRLATQPGVGLALAAVLPVMHVSYGYGSGDAWWSCCYPRVANGTGGRAAVVR